MLQRPYGRQNEMVSFTFNSIVELQIRFSQNYIQITLINHDLLYFILSAEYNMVCYNNSFNVT